MRYCNLLCSLLLLLPAGTSAKAYEPEVIGKGVTATWHGRGSILSIDTTIDSETVDSVRSYLAETEGYLTIELTGGGSDYRTAMDLGRVLAEYGGSAAVVPTQASGRTHSQCIDACAVTFLGINPRTAEEGSIAFTGAGVTEIFDFEASSDEVTESRLSILEEFGIYLYESYVDLRIIPRILSASERRSFVPDEIEIIDLGFKFSPSFSDFRLVPYGSGTIAYSRLEGEARAHEWDVHQVSTFCRSGAPRIILSSLPEYKLSILVF